MQIIVDDICTEYKDTGSGSVVLLLHGWGGNASSFDVLLNELNPNKRYISLSLPGFGRSEIPPASWSVADYAQFLKSFLRKLNIFRIDAVIAHSFGGRVAIKAVATGTLLPKKLVLIGSAGVSQKPFFKRCISVAIRIGKVVVTIIPVASVKNRLQSFASRTIGSEDYRNAGNLKGTFVRVINEDLRGDARKVKAPTLLIWGGQDERTPICEAETLRNCIQDSRLEIIEGADHFVFVTEVERVAEMINVFV